MPRTPGGLQASTSSCSAAWTPKAARAWAAPARTGSRATCHRVRLVRARLASPVRSSLALARPSGPTMATPASTCLAGTAGAARRACSRSGASRVRPRDRRHPGQRRTPQSLQAGVSAAAIPDGGPGRRHRRTGECRSPHLAPGIQGRAHPVPPLARRDAADRGRAALRGDVRPAPPVRAVPDLLPVRRHPQARHGHADLQGRLPGRRTPAARGRAARLPADGAGLRLPVPARRGAATRSPRRPGAAAPRAGAGRDAVCRRRRGGMRALARPGPT